MKAIKFLASFAYVVCTLGGFGTALYRGETGLVIAIVLLGALAFPTVRQWVKELFVF